MRRSGNTCAPSLRARPPDSISAAGGRFLVRGTPAKTLEAGIAQRTVVTEFDSVARAVAAYESPAYQAALKLLGDTAVRDIRIVEAVD